VKTCTKKGSKGIYRDQGERGKGGVVNIHQQHTTAAIAAAATTKNNDNSSGGNDYGRTLIYV